MKAPFFLLELKADFSLDDCVDFLNALTEKGQKVFRNLCVALPLYRLQEITKAFPDSGITFGSALLNLADPGAFTAPIAGKMVKDAHGSFALIGSSFERNRLKLTDEQLKNKLLAAKQAGLKSFYAVGGGLVEDEEALIRELELLKSSEVISHDPHPAIVYELDFKQFQLYLPSEEELNHAANFIKQAIAKVFGEDAEKFAVLAALPADLIGFSTMIETLPFEGAFFSKSGTYPHSVHDETVKLVHVHCLEEE